MTMPCSRVVRLLRLVCDSAVDGDWPFSRDLLAMYQPAFWRYFAARRRFFYRGMSFRDLWQIVAFVVDHAVRSARPPLSIRAFCESASDLSVAPVRCRFG